MEHSTQTPDYSKESPEPLPSVTATRKALVDRVVVDAIDAYEDAHRRYKAYEAATGDDGALEQLTGLAFAHLEAARTNLVRALLARDLNLNWGRATRIERTVQRTCGVVHGGRMYQASVIPDYADAPIGDEPAHNGAPVMKLVVSDVAAVPELGGDDLEGEATLSANLREATEDLDADPDQAAAPKPDEDLDESARWTTEPPKRQPVRVERPPLALVRTTMTINSPSEPGYLTSIDVVVYDQELEGQAGSMVGEGRSFAEIREAGWSFHALGPMTIGFRTVC